MVKHHLVYVVKPTMEIEFKLVETIGINEYSGNGNESNTIWGNSVVIIIAKGKFWSAIHQCRSKVCNDQCVIVEAECKGKTWKDRSKYFRWK